MVWKAGMKEEILHTGFLQLIDESPDLPVLKNCSTIILDIFDSQKLLFYEIRVKEMKE